MTTRQAAYEPCDNGRYGKAKEEWRWLSGIENDCNQYAGNRESHERDNATKHMTRQPTSKRGANHRKAYQNMQNASLPFAESE
jgi:hypothetical protein